MRNARPLARLCAVLLFACHAPPGTAQPAASSTITAKYPIVARCFFVYAALYQSARKHDRPALEGYAIQRLMWTRGFMEARADDPIWRARFDADIKKNKSLASSIDSQVSVAAASNLAADYNAAIADGVVCDSELGLYRHTK